MLQGYEIRIIMKRKINEIFKQFECGYEANAWGNGKSQVNYSK